MGVAVGSSIQIALLVTPFLVILGWIMGVPMTLQFETCKWPRSRSLFSAPTPPSQSCANMRPLFLVIVETVAFFISVLVVTYTVQDGKSNYLEGAMLMGLYVIIALAFYASPSEALDKVLVFLGRSG